MNTLKQALSDYFGQPPSPELGKALISSFKPRELKKNEFLIQEGRPCKSMAFITSGWLRQYFLKDGSDYTQWVAGKGQFITDLNAFFFDGISRWNVQAISEVQILEINQNDYLKLREEYTGWTAFELAFIAKCFTIIEGRLSNLLSCSAAERYEQFSLQFPELFKEVPQHYIASVLGMSPETFSRIRAGRIS